jgi:pyruvate formate lyase activating enzyme
VNKDNIEEARQAKEEFGWITDLQDFVVHDGPGLRVIVFLSGCSLRCTWCQNPETQEMGSHILYHSSKCLGCGKCIAICPVPGAIIDDNNVRIDRSKCVKCMACVRECLGKALVQVGNRVSVQEVMRWIGQYKPFFDRSDRGGVTLSGGDPVFQSRFALKILEQCKSLGIHTVIETCGYAKYSVVKALADESDMVIYDIKHMDEKKHIQGTGQSNSLILENLKKLCEEVNTEIIIHIPLICGFNDDDENIRKTAEFIASLHRIKHVDLLPFNELASEKYNALGWTWEYAATTQQPKERLTELQKIVEPYGLEVCVGGLW